MADWTTARSVDGPMLVAWIEAMHPDLHDAHQERDQAMIRRLYEWRHGGAATIYAADRWLTRLGHHLSELPDAMFRDFAPQSTEGRELAGAGA